MKHCQCVQPELDERDGYAYCTHCTNWFNTDIWKKHWEKKVEVAIDKQKIGRNDPCSCTSGKKYKKCCMPQKVRGIRRNPPPVELATGKLNETIIDRERRIEKETKAKS